MKLLGTMKLLFDENLSPVLVRQVGNLFPDSAHIQDLVGPGTPDPRVWAIARDQGFVIVSKDNDFRQRSFLEGAPPKVMWLSVGNAGTRIIAALLRERLADLMRFEADAEASLLVVSLVA